MSPSLSRGLWLFVASGVIAVIGLGLWLVPRTQPQLPLPPPPSLPFQVVFHGPRDAQAEAALVAALEAARKRWKDFTEEELQLNPHRPVHFVTRLEAMPRHSERVVHPSWEKFEACEGAVHFAPYYLTSEKPLPARPDYAELQDLLERELLRKGLIVLRGFEPPPWLSDGAISAVIGKHLPQQKRSPWPELWHRRKEDRMSRLAWLCGEGIHGDMGLCFARQSNPWILPVLRYLRETRGSRVVVETLRTVESPEELLSAVAPELSEKSLRAFDDNFETYAQQHWSELIPPPAGASSPAP